MNFNDFIGKTVISTKSNQKFRLHEITSSFITVAQVLPNESGYYPHYRYETINSDPVSDGRLIFEDASITNSFVNAYTSYCNSESAYWEDYGYWMRKD